eukprot:scaffold130902_cov30-Tisochrysis_lutea.AAC.1
MWGERGRFQVQEAATSGLDSFPADIPTSRQLAIDFLQHFTSHISSASRVSNILSVLEIRSGIR